MIVRDVKGFYGKWYALPFLYHEGERVHRFVETDGSMRLHLVGRSVHSQLKDRRAPVRTGFGQLNF